MTPRSSVRRHVAHRIARLRDGLLRERERAEKAERERDEARLGIDQALGGGMEGLEQELDQKRNEYLALLRSIVRNDQSATYAHHERRAWDNACPRDIDPTGPTRWLTPREIAIAAIRAMDEQAPDSFEELLARRAQRDRDAASAVEAAWEAHVRGECHDVLVRTGEPPWVERRPVLERAGEWVIVLPGADPTVDGVSLTLGRLGMAAYKGDSDDCRALMLELVTAGHSSNTPQTLNAIHAWLRKRGEL